MNKQTKKAHTLDSQYKLIARNNWLYGWLRITLITMLIMFGGQIKETTAIIFFIVNINKQHVAQRASKALTLSLKIYLRPEIR